MISYYFVINNFQETIGRPLGKIVLADPDPDGHVRQVTVEISRRGKNSDHYDKHRFKRPIHECVLLIPQDDVPCGFRGDQVGSVLMLASSQ